MAKKHVLMDDEDTFRRKGHWRCALWLSLDIHFIQFWRCACKYSINYPAQDVKLIKYTYPNKHDTILGTTFTEHSPRN